MVNSAQVVLTILSTFAGRAHGSIVHERYRNQEHHRQHDSGEPERRGKPEATGKKATQERADG
jgi:hypothetical protein